jgi:hypothetical protein
LQKGNYNLKWKCLVIIGVNLLVDIPTFGRRFLSYGLEACTVWV